MPIRHSATRPENTGFHVVEIELGIRLSEQRLHRRISAHRCRVEAILILMLRVRSNILALRGLSPKCEPPGAHRRCIARGRPFDRPFYTKPSHSVFECVFEFEIRRAIDHRKLPGAYYTPRPGLAVNIEEPLTTENCPVPTPRPGLAVNNTCTREERELVLV